MPGSLGTLFVRVSPVVYLFFNKFSGADGAERSAGQVEVGIGSDGHHVFIVIVEGTVGFLFFFSGKKVFGLVTPGAVVIFIQNDTVPIHQVYLFVACLDSSRFVAPQQVLERTEIHQGARFVCFVQRQWGVARDELPAPEVSVVHQVRFPSVTHGGFESKYQQAFPAHTTCQLVGGKSFAKAHFAVPEEMRGFSGILFAAAVEVSGCFFHSFLLFGAHAEGFCALAFGIIMSAHNFYGLCHFAHGAAEPFSGRVGNAHATQAVVHFVVGKRSAIFAHGRSFVADGIGQRTGP